MDDRGDYSGKSLSPVLVIGGGLLALILAASPGTRHWIRHGVLPGSPPKRRPLSPVAKKRSREYERGYELGSTAARDEAPALLGANLRSLELDLQRGGAKVFDKGYAAGYRAVVDRR